MSGARYIYGRHPVSEALRARPREVQQIFLAGGGRGERLGDIVHGAERHAIPVVTVSRRALEDLVGDVPHQGVVAAVAAFTYRDLDDLLATANERHEKPLLLALDQVQDPHNLGSLARSAFALGAHGLLFPKDNSCEVTPTVVKSSAGATEHLGMARVTNLRRSLEELKSAGLWVVGTAAGQGEPLWKADLCQPTVIVVGGEGFGLRRLVAETCDLLVHIPMAGSLGSLNASVAGSILLYEAIQQRSRGAS